MMTRIVLLALWLCACRDNAQETRTSMPSQPNRTAGEQIEENTVAELSGRRVGVFNIWERPYERADGTQVTGVAARLSISDGKTSEEQLAGMGSRVTIGGDVYEVVGIDDGKRTPSKIGYIVLKRVTPP
jgi:hypothetical protein